MCTPVNYDELIHFFDARYTVSRHCVYNSRLEFFWNIAPMFGLSLIVGPSFTLLYLIENEGILTYSIRVIGNQWYWTYEIMNSNETEWYDVKAYDDSEDSEYYEDCEYCQNAEYGSMEAKYHGHGGSFRGFRYAEEEASPDGGIVVEDTHSWYNSTLFTERQIEAMGQGYRGLETDSRFCIFRYISISALVSSMDVLHSWAVPSLGVKTDACPGRVSKMSVWPNRQGVMYGQCSEICGINHAYMPVVCIII